MRVLFSVMFLAALSLMNGIAAENVDDDSAIAAKAAEITKDKTQRIEKDLAVYSFVKDQIAQAPTQYG